MERDTKYDVRIIYKMERYESEKEREGGVYNYINTVYYSNYMMVKIEVIIVILLILIK